MPQTQPQNPNVNLNPAIRRASVGDVVQKTTVPNIGCLGVVRYVDDIAVIAVNRSPKANDGGADIFTIEHGKYTVIGPATVKFPKDPPATPTIRFDTSKPTPIPAEGQEPSNSEPGAGIAPDAADAEKAPSLAALVAKTAIPESNDTPAVAIPPGMPTMMPKLTQQQREGIGGITVSGRSKMHTPTSKPTA